MSTPTELWKKWEGQVLDGKYPLRQWLGGSDHSAVFLSERSGGGSQKIAVKLISAEKVDEDTQLARWASAAKLSHPHLIRLLEWGGCVIDGTRVLYVAMEYAEEDLAQILPLRALSPAEVSEMLGPAAEALASMHEAGIVHSRIRPSNVMAVGDQVKISTDGLRQAGERDARGSGIYDAPEIATAGLTPAADVWSLGATLVAVLTQHEPTSKNAPEGIPEPFRKIVRECLQLDPQRRCTLNDIVRQIQPQAPAPAGRRVKEHAREDHLVEDRPKRWIVVPIIVGALFLIAWVGSKWMSHPQALPAADSRVAVEQPAGIPAAQSPAPFFEKPAEKKSGMTRGSVLQQVQPDVSRSAQNTITGRLKVSVQVEVDASGNVAQAKLVSAGPSKYFAERALAAARRWKFTPPQVNGEAAASSWVLRFQFGRTSIQVFPAEINR